MAQNPLIKRYLDAGLAFTQMTQAKAEEIVRDLVKTGEVQANRTEDLVNELIDRSRRNTEALLDLVRAEVRNQLASLGLVADDGTGVEEQIAHHRPPQRPPAPAAEEAKEEIAARAAEGDAPEPAETIPASVAEATKAATEKATTTSGAEKAPAKKRAAKKAAGKRAAGKKAAAKKTAGKKAAGKKAAAKKASGSGGS